MGGKHINVTLRKTALAIHVDKKKCKKVNQLKCRRSLYHESWYIVLWRQPMYLRKDETILKYLWTIQCILFDSMLWVDYQSIPTLFTVRRLPLHIRVQDQLYLHIMKYNDGQSSNKRPQVSVTVLEVHHDLSQPYWHYTKQLHIYFYWQSVWPDSSPACIHDCNIPVLLGHSTSLSNNSFWPFQTIEIL